MTLKEELEETIKRVENNVKECEYGLRVMKGLGKDTEEPKKQLDEVKKELRTLKRIVKDA